jgi:hypothetical protein
MTNSAHTPELTLTGLDRWEQHQCVAGIPSCSSEGSAGVFRPRVLAVDALRPTTSTAASRSRCLFSVCGLTH